MKEIMLKSLILVMFPALCFSQPKLKQITLFNGKVEILIPDNLKTMSNEDWEKRHHNKEKSEIALIDDERSIEFTAEDKHQKLSENRLNLFKRSLIQSLKSDEIADGISISDSSIRIINSKKVIVIKMTVRIPNAKAYSYCYLYTILDGNVVEFTITYPESLVAKLQTTVDEIVESLKVK